MNFMLCDTVRDKMSLWRPKWASVREKFWREIISLSFPLSPRGESDLYSFNNGREANGRNGNIVLGFKSDQG